MIARLLSLVLKFLVGMDFLGRVPVAGALVRALSTLLSSIQITFFMTPPATVSQSTPIDLANNRPAYNSHAPGSIYSNASFSSSSSTFTVSGLPSASQGEEVAVDGLPHSEARLEARLAPYLPSVCGLASGGWSVVVVTAHAPQTSASVE